LDRSIVAGFDLGISQGTLCEEPCQGVGMVLEEWIMGETSENSETTPDLSQLQGQLISASKQTFRAALKKLPLRLVVPMYKCKVSTTSNMMGRVHSVLAQRRAKVF
jgi:ribosome assembly protein 1